MVLRCLIVDDSPGFREAIHVLLEAQGIEVVGGAASAAEALAQIAELRPDVTLIDLDLGGESGLVLARRIHDGAVGAVPKVILISTHDERDFADLIEATHAVGFLSKTSISAATIRRTLATQCSE